MNKILYIIFGVLLGTIGISYAAAAVTFPVNGGTGTSTIPSIGQILVGQLNGTYGPQNPNLIGLSTTTADYVVSIQGNVVSGLKTSTGSILSTSTSADVVLNAISTDASSNALSNIYVMPGTYPLNATSTFNGSTDFIGKTFVITGAGQSSTNFVVASTTDGFLFNATMKVILSNFTIFLSGNARGIVSNSNSGFRSLWNSNFSNIAFTGTTSNSIGYAFDLTNDDHNIFNNIYISNIGNCFRSRTDTLNLFNPGDETLNNIWCSFGPQNNSGGTIIPQNTYTGGSGYTFDGSATSTIVNQDTLINVGAFDPSGLRTAFNFNHASGIRGIGLESEGFSTTTQSVNSRFLNLDFEYVIQSSTSTNPIFNFDASSTNNTVGCTYVDSKTGTFTLFSDLNSDAKNKNTIQGVLGGNCSLNGSGTFNFSTAAASIIHNINNKGTTINQLDNFSVGTTSNSSLVQIQGNSNSSSPLFSISSSSGSTLLTVLPSSFVGINTNTPVSVLDVNGTPNFRFNVFMNQSTGGYWMNAFNTFQNGIHIDSAGDIQIRQSGSEAFTISTSTRFVGIGTTTPITSLQVATTTSNATTTITIGKVGQNKGSCLELYDAAGTAIYAWVQAEATSFTLSTTSCK